MYNNYYFTFGSDEHFPFQNGYIVIQADTKTDALKTFQSHYPNREGSDSYNYSFMYEEQEFNEKLKNCYSGPKKILLKEDPCDMSDSKIIKINDFVILEVFGRGDSDWEYNLYDTDLILKDGGIYDDPSQNIDHVINEVLDITVFSSLEILPDDYLD